MEYKWVFLTYLVDKLSYIFLGRFSFVSPPLIHSSFSFFLALSVARQGKQNLE